MKVTLISHTPEPENILVFTKNTRLKMSADGMNDIRALSEEQLKAELDYMVHTIKSSWEFCDLTFMIEGVSRAFTHQFVRNRTGSYAQQTMRILNMDGFEYVTGPSIKCNSAIYNYYRMAMGNINDMYNDLIEMGASVEDARGILPTNICTNIVAKFNLRSLSDMMASRASSRTQNEYRDVIEAMYQEVTSKLPWTAEFLRDHKHYALQRIENAIRDTYEGTDKITDLIKLIDQVRNSK